MSRGSSRCVPFLTFSTTGADSCLQNQKPLPSDEANRRWRVGGTNGIKLEDLILVSMHHVSRGSWQPQLRLRSPRN